MAESAGMEETAAIFMIKLVFFMEQFMVHEIIEYFRPGSFEKGGNGNGIGMKIITGEAAVGRLAPLHIRLVELLLEKLLVDSLERSQQMRICFSFRSKHRYIFEEVVV